jgi:molybdopterin-guanine dinucleotide biosynthesis protein A
VTAGASPARGLPGLVAGIFVGGASRRMGGRPKGLLLAPGDGASPRVTVVERTIALARERCAEVVLVGRAEAYAALAVHALADATTSDGETALGPLAGLVALLEHAGDRAALALACDMPYLTRGMMGRLSELAPGAVALAARDAGAVWSPLFARYDARRLAPVARAKLEAGERSLRVVLDAVETHELPLSAEERRSLRDWDTPQDVEGEGS